jgi:cell division protein FtsZ
VISLDQEELRPRICVIGVGGAGGNAVARMIGSGVPGVRFIVANTDAQALLASPAQQMVQLGRRVTQGLGAGSQADIGRMAAEESLGEIEAMLEGVDMCFIAAGMGGGTGTGAAPVIARAARAMGILTVGIVTKPFGFEGARRARIAEAGVERLLAEVDTLIVVPNQNLFRVAGPETGLREAFAMADGVLQQGVRGVTDLIALPGLINLDFADIRTIMAGMGKAMMGTGEASGDDRALRAAQAAIDNPLLDEAVKDAGGLILSITGGSDLGLMEVDEAATHIKALIDPEAEIIWGSAFDPSLEGKVRVSIVATGIEDAAAAAAAPVAVPAPAPVEAPAPAAIAVSSPIAVSPPIVLAALREGNAAASAAGREPAPFGGSLRFLSERAPEIDKDEPLLRPLDDELPEPEADEPAPCARPPFPGPSLFDRMAKVARTAVARREPEPAFAPLRRRPMECAH